MAFTRRRSEGIEQTPFADDAGGASTHQQHPVRHPQRLVDVMNDQQGGARVPVNQLGQQRLHCLAGDRVQGGERLVEQSPAIRLLTGAVSLWSAPLRYLAPKVATPRDQTPSRQPPEREP